jgi:hypothetical protein
VTLTPRRVGVLHVRGLAFTVAGTVDGSYLFEQQPNSNHSTNSNYNGKSVNVCVSPVIHNSCSRSQQQFANKSSKARFHKLCVGNNIEWRGSSTRHFAVESNRCRAADAVA